MTQTIMPVRVDVWSDVQCIWCYIAAPRFQDAVERFDGEVEVTYHSFLLTPDSPVSVDRAAQKRHHQASNPRFEQIMAGLTGLTAAEGLEYQPDLTKPTNSRSSMELLHHAGVIGRRPLMMTRLFRAYFAEGRHLGSPDELTDLAADIGFDRAETRTVLADHRYRPAVDADVAAARRLGATGAPFYSFNNRFGIAGAQSADTYLDLFHRAATA